ncbi:MAG: hypothetical protein M1542_07600 [Thermotogae bacterium]|jgi:hypothetical protein|nr:hypothetical protein [Thermotogota bacterium]MCL5033089.1 hypothetical protein [Thermotogota bacterium]
MNRYLCLVPITGTLHAGDIVEYDSTAHAYKVLASGTPAGFVRQIDSANYAVIQFSGIVYADELTATATEDLKAKLRTVGLFVEPRINA